MTTETSPWNRYWNGVAELRAAVGRSKAVNINADALRQSAERVVQTYFRELRPELVTLLGDEGVLNELDGRNQALLRLAQGRNLKASYVKELSAAVKQRGALAALREVRIGQRSTLPASDDTTEAFSQVEVRIIRTIEEMLPATALSYRQAILDLRIPDRLSYRGTAVELRETLREVLDHLAPDDEVSGQPGFTLEKGRQAPTMRQKAQFVLKSRGVSADNRKPPSDAVALADELAAGLVRSAYETGSKATHGAAERKQAERVKMWVDVALVELLHTGE